MFGTKADWSVEVFDRYFTIGDYAGGEARWCPGCGDYGVLNALYRSLAKLQIEPWNTVIMSGIGCSSRLPGYVDTYGFNSVHGRALTLATGVAFFAYIAATNAS